MGAGGKRNEIEIARITQYNMSRKMTEGLVKNRVGHSERVVGEWTSSPDEERHKLVPASQLAPE